MGEALEIDISEFDYSQLIEFSHRAIIDPANFELLIRFKSDYGQSKMIRDFVLHLFERNSIDVPWKNRFALISDELVNNSIEYGSLPLDTNLVHIVFHDDDGSLQVSMEISDTGRGSDAKTSEQMEEIRKNKEARGFDGYLEKRGRGLFQMISRIVDELYFRDNENGGLTVGVRKTLQIHPPATVAPAV